MEFNFNINIYFKNEITKVGSTLLPEGFFGDRREIQECISRMSTIMTVLGENSAKAQGLQKVITSGERLRNSDHIVYILTDPTGGSRQNGCVLGMLKVGIKHLYVFDASGNNHEVSANCILDFYIHESKQRMGLGKRLFEYMLQVEGVQPQHLAIDRPSPKFLSFLSKHYGLETIIPQMNNFALFEGFFTNRPAEEKKEKVFAAGISSSTARSLSETIQSSFNAAALQQKSELIAQAPSTPNVNPNNGYGRPAPHRPVSTMGLILQHQPPNRTATANCSPTENSEVAEAESCASEPEQEVTNPTPEPELEREAEEEEHEEEVDSPAQDEAAEEPAPEIPAEPLPCKIQAAKPPHLDLKFYHSSLW